jgi:hypothetical protein
VSRRSTVPSWVGACRRAARYRGSGIPERNASDRTAADQVAGSQMGPRRGPDRTPCPECESDEWPGARQGAQALVRCSELPAGESRPNDDCLVQGSQEERRLRRAARAHRARLQACGRNSLAVAAAHDHALLLTPRLCRAREVGLRAGRDCHPHRARRRHHCVLALRSASQKTSSGHRWNLPKADPRDVARVR